MSSSFHDRLVATRDRKHSKNHPFFELWAQGNLTREQTAFYCTQHYHFVGEFLNWLAYQGSQIRERDVKNYLFENLGDEEAVLFLINDRPVMESLQLYREEAAV